VRGRAGRRQVGCKVVAARRRRRGPVKGGDRGEVQLNRAGEAAREGVELDGLGVDGGARRQDQSAGGQQAAAPNGRRDVEGALAQQAAVENLVKWKGREIGGVGSVGWPFGPGVGFFACGLGAAKLQRGARRTAWSRSARWLCRRLAKLYYAEGLACSFNHSYTLTPPRKRSQKRAPPDRLFPSPPASQRR
jgi:hypothetical protein